MPSLDAYCQRIKELAEQLKDVGSPVTDQRLVIQLVRGLPAEFDTTGAIINQTLPTWDDAVDMLQQEIQRQEAREALTPTEARATISQSSNRRTQNSRGSGQQRSGSNHHGPSNYNRGSNQHQPTRGGPGNRRGGHSSSSAHQRPYTPGPNTAYQQNPSPYGGHGQHQRSNWAPPTPYWPPYWAGPFQPPPCPYPTESGWASPWAPPNPGSSGPTFNKPSDAAQQHAHLTEVNPLDSSELEAAFSAMTMEPDTTQWTMDTGATSHLASKSVPEDWEAPEST
ncbi:H/ACA ribonucleoprotein complex non-core subunit NAF1-like [Helianthus annuus]|uniref:H/ACA ribonucleoprotein complex non-core subunit NAF1-like n=1 Tax=Helianthus annuus TaxID=4232 RepID=UPI000B901708|nr:H/ACA ribonucleoprotein complex non-core subunit NAF1-like [Helianthus annuus]